MKHRIRTAALFALPMSLLAAATYLAAGLTLLLVLCTTQRRRVRLAIPVLGVLVAGLLAAVQAWSADTLGAASAPLLAGPIGTWLLWLAMAAALAFIYVNLSTEDAPIIALGSAVAAMGAGLLALYQVIGVGELRASLLTFHPNLAAAGIVASVGGILVGFSKLWPRGIVAKLVLLAGLGAGLLGLLLTGSRGGQLAGLAGTLVVVLVAASRVRWRTLFITSLALVAAGTGLYVIDRALRGPGTPNLFVNSGFEAGLLPWVIDGTGERVMFDSSGQPRGYVVSLRRDSTSTFRLLRYANGTAVPLGDRALAPALTFSLDVMPTAATPDEHLSAILLFEAQDADGNMVSRLGVDGWTAESDAGLDTVGGRPRLPSQPLNEWQRFSISVPPAPPGATNFRIELQPSGRTVGSYGLVDDLMLAPASAGSAYIPGPRPGLFTFLSPATSRLQQLRQPFTAAGGRVSMWFLGLDLAAARPVLGYGPGSERMIAEEYGAERVRRPLLHFHSFYLRLLLEGGSVLLATVLVMVGYLLLAGVRGVIAGTPGSLALVATIVALLVQCIFDPVLAFGEVVGGLWLVIAVAGRTSAQLEDTV